MEIAILVVLAYITLYIVFILGVKLSENSGKSVFNVIAFLTQPLFIIGVGYLYKAILIYVFDFTESRATDIMHIAGYWFIGLSLFFIIFVAFRPTHETKSGKADKRYKNNPAIAGGQGCYLLSLFIYVGSCVYVYNYFTGNKNNNQSPVKTQIVVTPKEIKTDIQTQSVKSYSLATATESANSAQTETLRREQETLQREARSLEQPQYDNSVRAASDTSIKMPIYTSPEEKQPELKFNEGIAYFKANNGLYGFVNQAGNIVVEPKFKAAGGFYNGRAVVQTDDELWGYIDKQGNWIVKPQFCMAGRFSEGLAAVYVGGYKSGNECYGGKWGYVTVTGKMAIEPKFERAWYFSKDGNGIAKAKVELGNYTGYINGRGDWVN